MKTPAFISLLLVPVCFYAVVTSSFLSILYHDLFFTNVTIGSNHRVNETETHGCPQPSFPFRILFAKTFSVGTPRIPLACYKQQDMVCDTLAFGSWEPEFLRKIIIVAELIRREQQSIKKIEEALHFLDIGMNVGALAFPLWVQGFHVTGFEPSHQNRQLLTLSQCLINRQTINGNSTLPEFTVLPVALGTMEDARRNCRLVHDITNTGNKMVVCHDEDRPKKPSSNSEVQVQALDNVFVPSGPVFPPPNNVVLLVKIDVEFSAAHVILGGKKFFTKYKPRLVLCEAWTQPPANFTQLVEAMMELGYIARTADDVQFTSIKSAVQYQERVPRSIVNLYFTLRSDFKVIEALREMSSGAGTHAGIRHRTDRTRFRKRSLG